MGHLKRDFLRTVMTTHPGYDEISRFVETGTFKGQSINAVCDLFKHCFTIELSEKLYSYALANSKSVNVSFMLGDSATILPQLCKDIKVPTIFYLDAHWFKWAGGVAAENPFPLWTELQAIKDRKKKDIVIVDDFHAFGRTHLHSHEEDPLPWCDVSPKSIDAFIGKESIEHTEVFKKLDEDVYVIWMKGA